jgi:aminoglycoside phosphotransferase (APT) family kinase protein
VLLSDFSREVADVDVIVMDLVPGTPWDTVADSMSAEANASAHAREGAILASLHTLTGPRFGYPARDFALGGDTWPGFFAQLIDSAIADARAWDVDIEPDRLLAAVEKGAASLAEVTVPHLIHNDLWHGNVLIDPATGHVHGVVDFERSLFADPLWDFVGAESMTTTATTPALLSGYEAAGGTLPRDSDAGTATGFSRSADIRTTLYRLWAMSVQFIEIVPRGFHGDWVTGHRATILANRAALFERAGV